MDVSGSKKLDSLRASFVFLNITNNAKFADITFSNETR